MPPILCMLAGTLWLSLVCVTGVAVYAFMPIITDSITITWAVTIVLTGVVGVILAKNIIKELTP